MHTTHTHQFISDVTEFTVNYRTDECDVDEFRFTCSCGYYTTYHNGLEWHNADGEIIPPGTP